MPMDARPITPSPRPDAEGARPSAVLDHLRRRRSVVANALGEPGPDRAALEAMLTIGARVPDHKKLAPWRFIVIEGEARAALGTVLATACAARDAEATETRLATERDRFLRAPVVVAVISRATAHPAVPEWEQILSAGAVCLNLLHAAGAMGFAAQWITEWYAYEPRVMAALGLEPHERIAGFVYIGTAREAPVERDRPVMAEITSYWRG